MKRIYLIFIAGIVSTILIYNYTFNQKFDVMIIGDSVATGDTSYGNSGISYNLFLKEYLKSEKLGKYDMTYTKKNMTVRDFNYMINENNEIDDKHLQNRIKESELIIISLGQDELVSNSKINNLQNTKRKEFYQEYKKLLFNIRTITQKPIYIIGYYGNNINQLNEIEKNIQKISQNMNCSYLSISEVISSLDYFDKNLLHLNYVGHKKIFEKLKAQKLK